MKPFKAPESETISIQNRKSHLRINSRGKNLKVIELLSEMHPDQDHVDELANS